MYMRQNNDKDETSQDYVNGERAGGGGGGRGVFVFQ